MNDFKYLSIKDTKIVFLENKKIADYFYKHFYKHGLELIIVTGDNSYPKDKDIRERIWHKIKTDPNIKIVAFSKKSMGYLKNAATNSITILHDLLLNDVITNKYYNNYTKNYKFNLNEISFSYLIHTILNENGMNKYIIHGKESNLMLNRNTDPFEYDKETNTSKVKWQGALIDSNLNPNECYHCSIISWDQIRQAWAIDLWKDRKDTKNMSAMSLTINQGNVNKTELEFIMRYENCSEVEAIQKLDVKTYYSYTHDMRIFNNYTPTFFGVFDGDKLIGVNSGHRTKDNEYRSRGLWVDPDYRGKKIGKILLQSTINRSVKEGCKLIWTLPRQSSMPTYSSVGFEKQSDWISEGMEYGPNCIAIKYN
jgi:GNAT superfamily N-acetyltransferase